MDLPTAEPWATVIAGQDARTALDLLVRAGERFDQVILDTYANQVEIPAHLATRELFARCREALRPGGWLTINVGGFAADDPVLLAVAGTAASAFDHEASVLRVPFSRNWAVHLRRDASVPTPGSPSWLAARGPARTLLGALEVPGASLSVPPLKEAEVLTDDRSPLEDLQRRSLALARQRRAAKEAAR